MRLFASASCGLPRGALTTKYIGVFGKLRHTFVKNWRLRQKIDPVISRNLGF